MTLPAVSVLNLHVVDYVIIVLFIVISTGIGLYHALTGGRQKTTSEFLTGGGNMQMMPVAISMVVSIISGAFVLGHPAEVYTRGVQFSLRALGQVIGCGVCSVTLVPLFYGLQVTSAFEYLERRYRSKTVKLVGSVTMLLSLMVQMGVVLYAPAVAMLAVTGFPIWASVCLTATVSIIYTTLGGMKAVIWTDVFQASCMVVGMIAIIISGTIHIGGFEKVWNISSTGGRLELFDFTADPTQRINFWSVTFGSTFSAIAMFGVGQTSVQRFCSLPTLAKAKWSFFINAVLMVLLYLLATFVGLVIYAYYFDISCDPLKMRYITSANQLVPYFILNVLNYPGIQGAFLAVLFGGALSTMSSSLNSSAAVTWQDILKHFFEERLTDERKTLVTRLLIVIYGLIASAVAFTAKYMGSNIIQTITTVFGTFYGPMLGLFLLGAIFPFANAKGAVAGCVVATAFNIWIAIGYFVVDPHKATLPTTTAGCNAANTSHNFYENGNYTGTLIDDVITMTTENLAFVFTEGISTNLTAATTVSSVIGTGLSKLYSISFLLYPVIGFLNVLVIGIIISLVTGPDDIRSSDQQLLIPIFDRFFCCLPLHLRIWLRCGIRYDDVETHSKKIENDHKENGVDDNLIYKPTAANKNSYSVSGRKAKKLKPDAVEHEMKQLTNHAENT